MKTDLPNSFNLALNENKPVEKNPQNSNVARNSDIANTKATENSAIKRLLTNSNLSISFQSGEDTIEDIDFKTEGYQEFSLPYGWKKVGHKRKSGASKDIWNFHVICPQGKKLRSNNDIFKYLEANPDVKCDQSVTNTSRKPEVLGNLSTLSDLIPKNVISRENFPLNKSSGTISEVTTLENQETKNSEASFTYKCILPEKAIVNIGQNDSGDGKIMLIQEKDGYREYSLPFGWQKIGRRRLNQKDWDFYIISPEGKKFRSTIGVHKYLDMHPEIKCDRNVTNTQLHENAFICPIRKKSSTSKSKLSDHISEVHEGKKQKCKFCDQMITKNNMSRHVKRNHQN